MRALAFLRSLAVSLGSVGVITLVSAPGASAEAVDYNTWLSTTTDAQGVPLEHYQNLPLDRGDIFHPSLALLADVMSFVWGIHFSLVTSLLWLLQYLLSFEWVALLVDPIQPIAGQVQGLLAELNWVAFASTIAGLTIGLLFISGRRSSGWGELVLTVTMVMLATGALMNPVTWVTGPGGMIDKSKTFTAQVAVEVTGGDSAEVSSSQAASQALNETVVRDLSTLLVRHPAQAASFGHALSGECDTAFTEATSATKPMDTKSTKVRDAVSDCDPDAKDYVSSANFFKVGQMLFMGTGVAVVLVLGFTLAVIFMLSVLLALFYATWQMVSVLIAILPGTSRTSFLRSFFGVLACMAVIIATTVLTAVFVNVLVSVLQATSGLGVFLQMIILFLVTVTLIVLILKVRRDLHKRGESAADLVTRLGLSKQGPARETKLAKFPRALGAAPRAATQAPAGSSGKAGESGRAGGGAGASGPVAGRSAGAPATAPQGGSHVGSVRMKTGANVSRPVRKTSAKGTVLRGAGLAAGLTGGIPGMAGGLAMGIAAERADRNYRRRRHIMVDADGKGRVVQDGPEVILDVSARPVDAAGPRRRRGATAPGRTRRSQELRDRLRSAKRTA